MQIAANAPDMIRVYWMTGCSSCLRTKEFLQKNGVPFQSRKVLEDERAFQEIERFGLKQVSIVTRSDALANGQGLRDVARLCGIAYGETRMLPIAEMRERLDTVLARAARFLKHQDGIPLTFDSHMRVPAPEESGRDDLVADAEAMRRRMSEWFDGPGRACDWSKRADIYYGEQTMHEFLARTVWHAGQHVRQLMWALEGIGVAPDGPLGPEVFAEVFAGLPMPEKVWDEADPSSVRRAS